MAKRVWKALPGGRLKCIKKSRTDLRPGGWAFGGVPPHWYRNRLNRRERRRAREAAQGGELHAYPYVHPRGAPWYW